MVAQSGSKVILKIGNGGTPETFAEIGGMRSNALLVENPRHSTNTVSSGPWDTTLENAGHQRVTLTGEGFFTDSTAENQLRALAFSHGTANFKMAFGDGETLSGPFQVSRYQRTGLLYEEESTQLTLISAGEVTVS